VDDHDYSYLRSAVGEPEPASSRKQGEKEDGGSGGVDLFAGGNLLA
jgi:hypothetical protein